MLNIIPWCYLTFPQYRTLSQERSSRGSLATHKSSTSKYPRNSILLQCGKTFCHRVYDICKYAGNIASMKTIYSTPTFQLQLDESAITSLIIRILTDESSKLIVVLQRNVARINRHNGSRNVLRECLCKFKLLQTRLQKSRRPWDLFHLTCNYFVYAFLYFRMFVGWTNNRNVIIQLHFSKIRQN